MARSSANAVARALAFARQQAQRQQPSVSPAGAYFGQPSPLQQQLDEWTFGRLNASLPRPASMFTQGAFGPLTPIHPVAIDVPRAGSERPTPRRWQYPVGWNMPVGVPGSEGLKIVPFAVCRIYADLYNVVRACIDLRINEICSLDWDIVPTEEKEKAMRGSPTEHTEWLQRKQEAVRFWRRPDPGYNSFHGWLKALLEDLFVVDAMTLYLCPKQEPGKGPFGSDLDSLWCIDGTTIRPLVDLQGSTPAPPAAAYQQYLWGVPRLDLTQPITSAVEAADVALAVGESVAGSLDEIEPARTYRGDQLLYLPYNRRDWTPYGFSNVEKAILPIAIGMRRQNYVLQYFTEGSVPDTFLMPGPDFATPEQIQQLQDLMDTITGDQAWKHKVFVLPAGSHVEEMKPKALTDQTDEVAMSWVCMSFAVQPMELGIIPKVSSTISPGASNQMAKMTQQQTQRSGLKPLMIWLKRVLFDHIIQDVWGQTDMEWHWSGLEPPEDQETKVNTFKTMISTGLMSIDEARVQLGLDPWGLPMTSDPLFVGTSGPIPLGSIDPSTGIPESGPPEPPPSAPGAPGGEHPEGERSPAHQAAEAAVQRPSEDTRSREAARIEGEIESRSEAIKGLPSAPLAEQLDELQDLGRFLSKGGRRRPFVPTALSPELVADLTAAAGEGSLRPALRKAQEDLRIQQLRRRLDHISAPALAALIELVRKQQKGTISDIDFLDQATQILRSGIDAAYRAGGLDAEPDWTADLVPQMEQVIQDRADRQQGHLMGFLQDLVAGMSAAAIANRLRLYMASFHAAYEQGYGETIAAVARRQGRPQPSGVWHLGVAKEHCAACIAREGKRFTMETLPCWPGDCHIGCQCWISWQVEARVPLRLAS
jgi:hypothetical protein